MTQCPIDFPAGYYWYGRKQHSPRKIPRWLEDILEEDFLAQHTTVNDEASADVSEGINDISVDVSGDISYTSGADVDQADSGDTEAEMCLFRNL